MIFLIPLEGMNKMKLLVFEYATALGIEDPSITAEGSAMLGGVLDDLKAFKPDYLISKPSENLKKLQSRSIDIDGDLKGWIRNNLENYDACLPIAPEENYILHDITLAIEETGVEVLGSNSEAVKVATNKFDNYNALKTNFPVIKTEKIFFKGEMEYGPNFEDGSYRVIKPADGVSCAGISVVGNLQEFMEARDKIKKLTKVPYFICQDYVNGVSASVSLLADGKDAMPISLNFQDVIIKSGEISYRGGAVPLEHELGELAKETASKAVESINGLKGYVGVDMLLDENSGKVHIVEINSRLTTPYVAIRKLTNINVGEAIIDSVHGNLPSEVELNGKAKFTKEGYTLRVSVLK